MIAEALRSMPEVESVTFEDSGQAYLNFKRQFKGDAELVKAITEKDLPESFRVLPRPDADRKRIVEAAEKMPGVSNVIDPRCPVPLARFILPGC